MRASLYARRSPKTQRPPLRALDRWRRIRRSRYAGPHATRKGGLRVFTDSRSLWLGLWFASFERGVLRSLPLKEKDRSLLRRQKRGRRGESSVSKPTFRNYNGF